MKTAIWILSVLLVLSLGFSALTEWENGKIKNRYDLSGTMINSLGIQISKLSNENSILKKQTGMEAMRDAIDMLNLIDQDCNIKTEAENEFPVLTAQKIQFNIRVCDVLKLLTKDDGLIANKKQKLLDKLEKIKKYYNNSDESVAYQEGN